MAVAAPRRQKLTLAWTPPATRDAAFELSPASEAMKRTSTTTPKNSSAQKKGTTKKRRLDVGEDRKPIKREKTRAESSHSDDSNGGDERENYCDAANGEHGSADEYKWPSLSRKRQRMSEDERKARHREVQRQFMQRKLAKLDEMRKLVVILEKQFLLLQLSQDRARLEHENYYLHRRVLANPSHWTHDTPLQQQQRLQLFRHRSPPPPLPHMSSHPHHTTTGHRQPTGMLPWDEILEAVSEANV